MMHPVLEPQILMKLKQVTRANYNLYDWALKEIVNIYIGTFAQVTGPYFESPQDQVQGAVPEEFRWYFEYNPPKGNPIPSITEDSKEHILQSMEKARKIIIFSILRAKKYSVDNEVVIELISFLCSTQTEKTMEIGELKNMDTEALLDERQNTHGSFLENARFSQTFKKLLPTFSSYEKLTLIQREALDQIMLKVGRILSGNPDHGDSWKDIAGYAGLGLRDVIHRKRG